MRAFHLAWPAAGIGQTPSDEFARDGTAALDLATERFPLPWSAYVALLAVKETPARAFYEAEALSGGWSVRQLRRQIASQFYQRTALSRDKAAMLRKGGALSGDKQPETRATTTVRLGVPPRRWPRSRGRRRR